jgi:homeobox-leucine zipper protein
VHDKDLESLFQPFIESGFSFGAKRWISTLQRQVEHFLFSMGINTSPSDTNVTPEGRRSLVAMANKMVVSFLQ